MPRDSAGNYSLPDGYLAVAGETIQPSQHNPPLEDIASALTGSVPRNGSAPMGAPLKLADGTAAQPSLTFNSATGTGFFLTSGGNIGFSVGGVQVAEFASSGIVGTVPIGAGMDYWLPGPAPAGWLLCYAQACPADKPALRSALIAAGNPYGASGGNPLLPDKRGRGSFGRDDMGGAAANRLTSGGSGIAGTTLGAAGGAQTHTLSAGQLPVITPTGISLGVGTISTGSIGVRVVSGAVGSGYTSYASDTGSSATIISQFNDPDRNLSINSFGSGQAHNNVPPGIVSNYIIYAGV